MGFDCLAERTLALAHARRLLDPGTGQDRRVARVVKLLNRYLETGNRVIGNFGAANPAAAARDVIDTLRENDLAGVRVGVVHGDDVKDQVLRQDLALPELGTTARAMAGKIVSANAYIGAEPIVIALEQNAQFVLGGRLADPSLFVGPICYELGWALDDWHRMGVATMIGHLLECGVHSTGGNFEDPPYRVVPDAHNLGYPLAEVTEDEIIITKLEGTGGAVNLQTTKTQLAYEIHDPTRYLTPDVTADFSQITVTEVGPNRVRVEGATGRPRPDTLKVLVGIDLGWKAVGEISYAGPGCLERARRGEEIVRKRLEPLAGEIDEIRYDLVGLTSLAGGVMTGGYPPEIRLRVAARCRSRQVADAVSYEVEYLYFGPAGAGGATGSVVPAIGVTPAFVPRASVNLETEMLVS
jgi:hypothetical protein